MAEGNSEVPDRQVDTSEPKVAGGELVTPTAVTVEDVKSGLGTQAAEERGWLVAMTKAINNPGASVEERQKNAQEIVDSAMAAGVPRDKIDAHLRSLGVNTVRKEEMAEEKGTDARHLSQETIADLKAEARRKAKQYELADAANPFGTEDDSVPTELMLERADLGDEIGQKFKAHGIAKGTTAEQFDALLRLLDQGIDTDRNFYEADLYRSDEHEIAGAVGAAGPYDSGGFIVLGRPRRDGEPIGANNIGKDGIAGVLVNREWYDAIPHLQQAYPNVRFIRADQMNQELRNWVQEA